MCAWEKVRLGEVIQMNPRERMAKGSIATKISMEHLLPFCRKIQGKELASFSGGSKFCNGDTLLARITPCLENGKTALVDILQDNEIAFGSTEFIVLREIKGLSDSKFIYYLMTSPFIRDLAIKSMVGSSGRQRVQHDVLSNLELDLPPLAEQKRIAAILSSLDDKIENNNAINRNLEEQAQALYSEMFFIDENSKWNKGKLSDFISIKYGKDHKTLNDGPYPVYGSGGVMRYVERPIYSQESVLIPRKGTLNNVIYINEPFWTVDTMFYAEMRVANAAKFIFHFLNEKNLASMNAGSAVPSMTTAILNCMELLAPPKEVLECFEKCVDPLYRKMQILKIENIKLTQIRDTLLPKLMSGELSANNICEVSND